jgi:ABC-type transporter Mla subunit MlaD
MTRRRVMRRLERDDVLALEVCETLMEHCASLDETMHVAATLIGWSLHQSHDTLDDKLETLTSLAREIRGLLIKNHGASRERED